MSNDKLMKLVDAYLAAYRAQDADGCARAFTTDGALFSPFGPPARGRAAIAETHSEWFTLQEEDKSLEVSEFCENGESGHCLLSWSARVPNKDEPGGFTTESGLSLCVLAVTGDEMLIHRLALIPEFD